MSHKKSASKAVSLALLLGLMPPLEGCEMGAFAVEGGESGAAVADLDEEGGESGAAVKDLDEEGGESGAAIEDITNDLE